MREVSSHPLTASDLDLKASQGWKPVAVIWERQVGDDEPAIAITPNRCPMDSRSPKVFDMLPRLIEVGPRVFSTQEWVVRRGKLMNVG
jgi:hypothetical protein